MPTRNLSGEYKAGIVGERIAALEDKKTKNTITDSEKKLLERLLRERLFVETVSPNNAHHVMHRWKQDRI